VAIKAVHQGVQDYLVKGDITNKQLGRALSYAVERQGLLRALEITRKQQLEFKNQFLSHVSHELRTPLTCIHQYVPILLDGLAGAMKPEQTDHLKTILKSVNQLHAMIRDLLEATRADSGKLRIEPRCIDVGELMQQAVAMMRPTAAEKHVGLQAALDQAVPLVYADPDRTIEFLINLIDAIKFTPANGSVAVLASMVETDPAAVYISVSDTGRGIPQESLPQVFERLYQDPDSVDDSRAGLGLGLFIAKEIVTLHGGRMWVASEPGAGSTFSFTLPLYSLANAAAPSENSRPGVLPITSRKSFSRALGAKRTSPKRRTTTMRTESHSEVFPLNRAKIMVVDDDPDLRQALSLRLRANNYDTVNACDGYSAIALAQKERPHLIILDLGLPAGDGFAVLKNLQEYPALSVMPVIVLTARDPEGNEERRWNRALSLFSRSLPTTTSCWE
jgi:signal transduction histidine kinase